MTVFAALLLLWPLVAAGAEGPKKVLIFNSEDPYLPVNTLLNQAIRSTLSNASPVRVQFYYEALEDSRIANEKYEEDLIRLLLRKYEGERFDLMYVLGMPAIRFLLKHKETLFPGTDLLYLVTDSSRLEGLNLGPNVTGVSGKYELKPTLDIALTLQAEIRQVFVVAGSAPLDQIRLAQAKKEFHSYEGRLDITYLTGRSIQGFQQAVAALPPRSIVLYLGMLADSAGNSFPGTEAVSLLKSTANAPIYAATQSHFGTGVVGGNLIDFETFGTRAGEVGLRVLAGERAQDIPPQIVPSVAMFDWRELKRWSIDESKLPASSIVRFKSPTFWEQFKWRIVGVISLLIVETLLIFGLLINLSRRRQAEKDNERLARLAEAEHQRLDEVVSNVPGIVWESRPTPGTNRLLVSFVSEHVEKMLGYSVDEWLSTPGFAMSIVAEEDRERTIRESQAILESGKDGVLQFRWVTKDGRTLWVESQVAVIKDEEGKPIGLRGVTMDVTDRKRAELEASQQRTALAHLSRVTTLGELSSSLAHELNQPLGAILRNTEAAELFLQDPAPDLEELRAILADIRKDDQRAGAVIDRMRAMVKRREVEYSLIDMNVLVSEVISLVRSDADSRRVRLAFEAASLLPPVSGDRVQLQQVLLNLLLNAMDAVTDSAPDRRLVSVRVQPAGTRVEVVVKDRGHGIPTDKLAHLFDPFFTTKPNGLGMGLPISRMIMEAHGGSIRAANDSGVGATFYLALPSAKEENAA